MLLGGADLRIFYSSRFERTFQSCSEPCAFLEGRFFEKCFIFSYSSIHISFFILSQVSNFFSLFTVQFLGVPNSHIVMCCLTVRPPSDKCIIWQSRRCAHIIECTYKTRRCYGLLHTQVVWDSLLLVGYKPAQHVTTLIL